jgi:hypothetical protein
VPGENKFGEVSNFPMEDSMYFNDENDEEGGSPQKPVINWDEDEKYAIIAFLLKSVDKNADEDGLARFDGWFGLNGNEAAKTDKYGELVKAQNTVISECENFLATLDSDDRYDRIVEEIDRFIEGGNFYDSTCVIGSSYDSYKNFGGLLSGNAALMAGVAGVMIGLARGISSDNDKAVNNPRLVGTAEILLRFLEFVIDDADYDGNKRRLLKHITRKWNLEDTVFSGVENGVKELSLINEEREKAKASSRPYSDVVEILADLDTREKAVWELLEEFDIPNPHGKAETTPIPPVLR